MASRAPTNLRPSQGGAKPKVCPMCGRTFAGKQALDQHRLSVHAGAQTAGAVHLLGGGGRGQRRRNRPQGAVSGVGYDGAQREAAQVSAQSSVQHPNIIVGPTPTGVKDFQTILARVIGQTPNGRAWAFAALHPCGGGEITAPNVGEVAGMSDTMTGSVASPNYRAENFLTFDKTLFQSKTGVPVDPTTLGTTTYGIDVLCPPIPEIDFLYRLIDDGTGTVSPWVVVRLPDFNLPAVTTVNGQTGMTSDSKGVTMASSGYGKVRIIGRGHTFELDAAGLNDQGRIVAGQMEGQWIPNILDVPAVTALSDTFVKTVDPLTTGSALTAINNYGNEATTKLWSLAVPTDPKIIVANCPAAYQGLAKHGCYAVTKFTSPLLGYEFHRTGSEQCYPLDDGAGVVGVNYSMPMTAMSIHTGSGQGYSDDFSLSTSDYFWVSATAGTNTRQSGYSNEELAIVGSPATSGIAGSRLHPFISDPSDMMVKVVTFRNLPAGATNALTSGVRVKSREYLECISNGSNPAVSPYIHPPCDYDMQALQSVVVAGKKLADGYPAAANSLGGILSKIWGAIGSVASGLGKSGIPILSDIGNVVSDVHGVIDPLARGAASLIPV